MQEDKNQPNIISPQNPSSANPSIEPTDNKHERVKRITSTINNVVGVLLIAGFLIFAVIGGFIWGTSEGGSINSAFIAIFMLGMAFLAFVGYIILPLFIAEKAALAIHKNRANKRFVKRAIIIILCLLLVVGLLFLENRRENMTYKNAIKKRRAEWEKCLQENTPYKISAGSNLYQPAVDYCKKVIKF